jgi:cell division protein FtsW
MSKTGVRKPGAKRRVVGSYDISLLLLVVLLCAFGVVMIYSTSYYNADRYYSESALYYSMQIRNLIFGAVAMILVSFVDYHFYVRLFFKSIKPIHALYLVCMVLQIIVAVAGYSANGSSRWLNVGPISFQPSELTKICLIIMSAYLATKYKGVLDRFKGFLPFFVIGIPIIGLVGVHDLSTAVVLAGITFIPPIVVSGLKRYHFVIAGLGIAALVIMITTIGYRQERLDVWLNPELQDPGSQTIQGLYAIASGGYMGKGLGEGLQKLGKIQEVHTDMIFTVVCEELGIAGAVIVILTFILLLWRIYVVAVNAKDMFGGIICTGVFIHIAMQVVINLLVVTNSIPATGIPLPFISYGGTSLVVLLAEMGLVLNVSKQIPEEGVADA